MGGLDGLNFARKRRLPVILAAEVAECGLACLAMVARWHGHDVDLGGLRQRVSVSMAGMTLRDLTQAADGLNLSARSIRIELHEAGQLMLPAVLHWNFNHFVVLKSVRADGFTIHDPALGERRVSLEAASESFTGVAVEFYPRAGTERLTVRGQVSLRSLFFSVVGMRRALLQVIGLSAALQLMIFAAPFQLQLVIDEALLRHDHELLLVLGASFGALVLFTAAVESLRAWSLKLFGLQASFQLVGNLVGHLLRLPLPWFEKRHTGDVMSRIGSANTLQDSLTRGVVEALLDGVMAVAAGAILFVYSPALAMVVVVSVALLAAVNLFLYPAIRRRSEERISASAREQSHMIESLRAATPLRVMGREAEREGEWRNLYADVVNAWASIGKYEVGQGVARTAIMGLQTVFVVVLGAQMIMEASGFSVGMLFAFLAFRQIFSDRAVGLIDQGVQFQLLALHLDRLGDIVRQEPETCEVSTELKVRGGVDLRDVSFRYGSSEPYVLSGINLEVQPGEFVAITGPSGGGKTTLLKLLLGLHAPTSGSVSLEGLPATPGAWRRWRQAVGLVAQDDLLLAGTIASNIAFFDPDLDMEQVRWAAGQARIHDDIVQMPMQYLSLVGDMGSALSGGQRQRVLLARALYRNPTILFLDEGTANLDPDSEVAIADVIAQMPVTRIVVAHRPALIERADRIIKVDGATLLEITKSRAKATVRSSF